MKVVVAIDDTPQSASVLDAACRRWWPRDVEFKVLSVLEPLPVYSCECSAETLNGINAKRRIKLEELVAAARTRIEKAVPDAVVHFEVLDGNPKSEIVKAALDWQADCILIGSHGRSVCPHFMIDSVSRSVFRSAHCTVDIIRTREPANASETRIA
jgi:nucleotide-binding universal stress UspA family protein